jgi:hypothetical protein
MLYYKDDVSWALDTPTRPRRVSFHRLLHPRAAHHAAEFASCRKPRIFFLVSTSHPSATDS